MSPFRRPLRDDSRAPSFTGKLATVALGVVLACAGGIAATVIYDQLVSPPADRPGAALEPPASAPLPPAEETPVGEVIDPLLQAIRAVRPDLPENAFLEITAHQEEGVVYLIGEAESRRTVAHASEAVGRVAGVRAVDVRGVRIVDRTHVVQSGESLSRIARLYYGEPTAWRRIVDANEGLEPDRVREGQSLTIPPLDR